MRFIFRVKPQGRCILKIRGLARGGSEVLAFISGMFATGGLYPTRSSI
jgi:hypothetical protein